MSPATFANASFHNPSHKTVMRLESSIEASDPTQRSIMQILEARQKMVYSSSNASRHRTLRVQKSL